MVPVVGWYSPSVASSGMVFAAEEIVPAASHHSFISSLSLLRLTAVP